MNITTRTAIKQLPNRQAELLWTYGLTHALDYLPAQLVSQLQEAQPAETPGLSALGLSLLPLATSFAVAPVSDFYVGAIAVDSQGNAYPGANFEFTDTHIGQVIHAEQSAIANAWTHGAEDLALLVINYPPCGHCRQFINEVNLADNFRIQLPDSSAKSLSYYLPDAFGPNDLNIDKRILGPQTIPSDKNNITVMAEWAYENSHAPYSGSKSGIALQYEDGQIVTGRYAENAAFNPTLPALQMALNTRRLQGKDWRNIQQAIMIETPAPLSQHQNTRALLGSFSAVKLDYIAK